MEGVNGITYGASKIMKLKNRHDDLESPLRNSTISVPKDVQEFEKLHNSSMEVSPLTSVNVKYKGRPLVRDDSLESPRHNFGSRISNYEDSKFYSKKGQTMVIDNKNRDSLNEISA